MQSLSIRTLCLCLALLVSGCASTPSIESMDDVFRRQVLFTIPEIPEPVDKARQDNSEILITSIIKLHKLKRVAQWSVKALGVEAIVAEFNTDRSIDDVLAALQEDNRIESVQPVHTYELLTYNDPYFHLQNMVPNHDLEQVHEVVTGKGVTVGIVDTGIDREHPELNQRIIYSRNYVIHDQQDFDTDEHGTTVAGVIAAAANNELGIVGVAPEAELMVFKACAQNDLTRRASCDSFSLMKALVGVLRQEPDVLNLSLAGPDDPLLARLIASAISKGIIVIASVDHANSKNAFPASTPGVIAVSSAFQFDHDWMPKNGVLAPGTEVLTTAPGATYAFRSGSSMSAAFVSGIAALMKEKDPNLSGRELSTLMHRTAQARIKQVPLVDICHVVSGPENEALCAGSAYVAVDAAKDVADRIR